MCLDQQHIDSHALLLLYTLSRVLLLVAVLVAVLAVYSCVPADVGKTAGTSLRCAFGFKPGYDDCRNTTVPAGYLPQVTTHLSHNRRNFCPQDDSSSTTRVAASNNHKLPRYYLFATRNPLHRIISWYTYEYPRPDEYPLFYKRKKPLYLDCPFGTLNDLAILGLGESSSSSSSDNNNNNNTIKVTAACRRRAWNAIRGREPYSRHNYYNYRWYWSETPPAAPLYVIRTEHLVQDWNSIEAHLHQFLLDDNDTQRQQGLVVVGPESFPRSNPTPKTSVTNNNNNNTIHDSSHRDDDDHQNNKNRALVLSPQARALLCRALCQEMQVYRQILHRAVNLTPRDVQVSLQELADSCPAAAVVEEPCPPSLNDDDDDSDDRYYWGLLILSILLLLVVVLGWRRRPRQQRKPYSL